MLIYVNHIFYDYAIRHKKEVETRGSFLVSASFLCFYWLSILFQLQFRTGNR